MLRSTDIRYENANHFGGLADQASGRFVRHIVMLFQKLQNTRPCGLFYMRISVDHARNGARRNARQLCDIINCYFFHGFPQENLIALSLQQSATCVNNLIAVSKPFFLENVLLLHKSAKISRNRCHVRKMPDFGALGLRKPDTDCRFRCQQSTG